MQAPINLPDLLDIEDMFVFVRAYGNVEVRMTADLLSPVCHMTFYTSDAQYVYTLLPDYGLTVPWSRFLPLVISLIALKRLVPRCVSATVYVPF